MVIALLSMAQITVNIFPYYIQLQIQILRLQVYTLVLLRMTEMHLSQRFRNLVSHGNDLDPSGQISLEA